MSNDMPNGPLFKPEDKDFFVVTNIGANAAFKAPDKSNNTIQFIGSQWEKLRMVEPEGTQEMLDANGKMVLAFEGTNNNNPGQVYLDADAILKTGYASPEGGSFAAFIANSDPSFIILTIMMDLVIINQLVHRLKLILLVVVGKRVHQ